MKKNNYEILSEIELRMPLTKAQEKQREKEIRDMDSSMQIERIKTYTQLAIKDLERQYHTQKFLQRCLSIK
jgi:hypothetical protein